MRFTITAGRAAITNEIMIRVFGLFSFHYYDDKYGFCRGEEWTREDAETARCLLERLELRAARLRDSLCLRGDDDAWLYPETPDEPPVDLELGTAAEGLAEASGCDLATVLAVAERLKEAWHLPAVLEAMGCLIPPALHPRLDGLKPKGEAQAGAACSSQHWWREARGI